MVNKYDRDISKLNMDDDELVKEAESLTNEGVNAAQLLSKSTKQEQDYIKLKKQAVTDHKNKTRVSKEKIISLLNSLDDRAKRMYDKAGKEYKSMKEEIDGIKDHCDNIVGKMNSMESTLHLMELENQKNLLKIDYLKKIVLKQKSELKKVKEINAEKKKVQDELTKKLELKDEELNKYKQETNSKLEELQQQLNHQSNGTNVTNSSSIPANDVSLNVNSPTISSMPMTNSDMNGFAPSSYVSQNPTMSTNMGMGQNKELILSEIRQNTKSNNVYTKNSLDMIYEEIDFDVNGSLFSDLHLNSTSKKTILKKKNSLVDQEMNNLKQGT